MGASLFKLWDKGVISWDEAVTPARIRSLQEVVSRQRLTVKTMVAAGVNPTIAQQAWDAVHTASHQAAIAQRRQILNNLQAAGISQSQVIQHIGQRLASRVNIAAGPSYTTRAGVVLPGIQAQQLASPADLRQRHADELAALLGGAAGVAGVIAAMKRRKKKAEEDESGDEPWKPLKPAE